MKTSILALAITGALLSPVLGADVFERGSLKDDGVAGISSTSRSGFYINGSLGIANIDRSISQQTTRENGDLTPEVLDNPETTDVNEAAAAVFETNEISQLINSSSGDFDSTVYGGGVSYLFHLPSSRFGIEVGVEGTGYASGDSGHAFAGQEASYIVREGEVLEEPVGTGFASSAGFATVDRKFDIDLIAKAHMFVTDRWSVYAGGGLSWAKADICGGSSNSLGIYDNAGCSDESAFGYVLVAGTQLWLTDRITLGAEYSYKQHDFDANLSTLRTGEDAGGFGYTKADDKVEVEDDVHTIKAKIGFKLN